MTLQAEHEPERWEALANLPEGARQAEILHLYETLVPMKEVERQARIEAYIHREYALAEDKLLAVTRSRLMAWLEMEPERAKTVATSYDLAMRILPGSIAMRHVAVVQTLSLAMTDEQIGRLYELIPSVLRQIPRLASRPQAAPPVTTEAAMTGGARTERRGWAFWKKG
ncbi:MAG: hypothetical protein HY688_02770 [Chloroflexi bacterium]|nr:hypothetical protein [Chloroflexota bacterium]